MSETIMRPCPFCGSVNLGVRERWQNREYGLRVRQAYGHCRTCKCRGPLVSFDEPCRVQDGDKPSSDILREMAVQGWNTGRINVIVKDYGQMELSI